MGLSKEGVRRIVGARRVYVSLHRGEGPPTPDNELKGHGYKKVRLLDWEGSLRHSSDHQSEAITFAPATDPYTITGYSIWGTPRTLRLRIRLWLINLARICTGRPRVRHVLLGSGPPFSNEGEGLEIGDSGKIDFR